MKTEDVLGGKARVGGRRISVYQIGELIVDLGKTPEYVADQFDLSLAEVHAALTYYYENLDEMEEIRERRRELEKELRKKSKAPRKVEG